MQITIPTLAKGERYAGIVVVDDKPAHHLVILPGESSAATWKQSIAWAKKNGGELPTRREQALCFANAPDAFKPDWYWSCEQHASYPVCAWYQYFGYGYQSYDGIVIRLRARAVRRLPIE